MAKQETAVCTYDFTTFNVDRTALEVVLKKIAKKFCYQLEECPTTKRQHLQGRFSLKVKERLQTICNKKYHDWHLSVTSNNNRDNDFYVMKEDSRIEGPWTEKDLPLYIPRDIKAITSLLPWQDTLKYFCGIYEPRKVYYVYEPEGCKGKSIFTRYMMCHKLGQIVPFCNDFKDLLRMVMDMPKSPCYLIDMPRAIAKEKLFQLYSAVEMVKSGYAYDDRYHFRQELFDPPVVVIFSNVWPDFNLLSQDRWRIFGIDENLCLRDIHIKPPPVETVAALPNV